VFIAYSTAEGKRAKDDGLFASSFVENAKIRGLTVEEVFKKVRERVKEETGQTPFTNSGIVGNFYFSLPFVDDSTSTPEPKVVKNNVYNKSMTHEIENISVKVPELEPVPKRINNKYEVKKNKNDEIININGLIYQNQPFSEEDENNFLYNQEGERVGNANYAQDYCRNLDLEGYTNWRLPTQKELLKLANIRLFKYVSNKQYDVWFIENQDKRLVNSKGNSYFIKEEFLENMPKIFGMNYIVFWTFTKNKNHPFGSVNFKHGYYGWGKKSRKGYILCVHEK